MSGSQDPRSLFAPYASGEIAAEQLHDLEAALREDSELRREFIEYLNVDSALSDLAALTPTELAEIEQEATTNASRKSVPTAAEVAASGWGFRSAMAAAAVAATLLLIATVWFNWPDNPVHQPVATLVTEVDALLLRDGQPCSDSGLKVGDYRLGHGLLHLQFDGGVMVYVEAPAEFEIASGKRLSVSRGRLSASVPAAGIGFTIDTPEAEVVDFGTEFSVDVEADSSEVHVFDGHVRVQPRTGQDGHKREFVDLRTSQAVKIDDVSATPVAIELASERFIRNFDEPQRRYPRSVKSLSPVAFYRMAIRDRGLACEMPQHSGVLLTGDGERPPHARGVFAGGALRVRADSTGRGGRVDSPPSLTTGQFALAVILYLDTPTPGGMVATNLHADKGSFAFSLNEDGQLQVTMRNRKGELRSVASENSLPLRTWLHVVVTADGQQLRIYEEGQMAASIPCSSMAVSDAETLWFGTDADGIRLWSGRIDELALFDKAISDNEVAELYRSAQEEMTRSR